MFTQRECIKEAFISSDTKYYHLQKLERKENDNNIFHVQEIEFVMAKEININPELISLLFKKSFPKTCIK